MNAVARVRAVKVISELLCVVVYWVRWYQTTQSSDDDYPALA